MQAVRKLAEDIVRRERGFVDAPQDQGHAGEALPARHRLGLEFERDGRVDISDLHALGPAQAVECFIAHYYLSPRIDALPPELRLPVFDMYVSSGANAVRILQRLLNEQGYDLEVDGVVGPQTVRAAQTVMRGATDSFADAYGIARRDYCYGLADRRPASRRCVRRGDGGKGSWITRAEAFIDPRAHLSDAEHRERVAAWG